MEEKTVKCIICARAAIGKYCEFHERAYDTVVQKFDAWQEASGVSWKEYLKAVVENSYTGAWVKELAEHLLKNKDG